MSSSSSSSWCWFGLAWLALPLVASADDNQIRVDVVMDATPAAKSLRSPTAENPVYYVPIPFGQEDLGPDNSYYRTPAPPKEQTEHLIAVMLASQHYLLMTKEGHPSLILAFRWGYKSPNVVQVGRPDHFRPNSPMAWRNSNLAGGGANKPGVSLSTTADIFPEIAGTPTQDPNAPAMEDLVGGHLVNFKSLQNETDPTSRELNDMTRYARWYVEITAMDYQAWLRRERIELWREYVSTDLWGRSLNEVLPTLVKTGGYFVGREMSAPALMMQSIEIPVGWSYLGKSVVVPEKDNTIRSFWAPK
jgi:hypothetical protein